MKVMSQDVELDPNKIVFCSALMTFTAKDGYILLCPAQIPLHKLSLPSHIFECPPVLTQGTVGKVPEE